SSLPIASDIAPLQGTGIPIRDFRSLPVGGNFKTWNSNNHNADGQNVAFSDGHVEFARRPDVGQDSDNIFTWNPATRGGPLQVGATPSGPGAISIRQERAPYDTVMIPARNLNTGGI